MVTARTRLGKHRLTISLVALGLVACSKSKTDDDNADDSQSSKVGGGVSGATSTGGNSATGGQPGKLTVTGNLAVDLGLAASAQPNKVLAFRLKKGVPTGLKDVVEGSVDASGAFKIDVEKGEQTDGTTYVFVGMTSDPDGDRVKEAESFRFIGLPSSDPDELLLNVPAGDAKDATLELGTISGSGDDLHSAKTATESSFSVSQKALDELAETDRSLKGIRNLYMNNDNALPERHANPSQAFNWDTDVSTAKNAFSSPADLGYTGYLVSFNLQGIDDVDSSTLCGSESAGFKLLALSPPASITAFKQGGDDGPTFGPATPLTNADTEPRHASDGEVAGAMRFECGLQPSMQGRGGDFGVYEDLPNRFVGWGGGVGFKGAVPEGLWTLAFDGKNIGNYDFFAATPLDADGKPLVYVPLLKLTVNPTTNEMSLIEIKMAVYDAKKEAYRELTDYTAFERVVSGMVIGLDDFSGITPENSRLTDRFDVDWDGSHGHQMSRKDGVFTAEMATLGHAWKYMGDDSTTERVADAVRVAYSMYGIQYTFDFRLRSPD